MEKSGIDGEAESVVSGLSFAEMEFSGVDLISANQDTAAEKRVINRHGRYYCQICLETHPLSDGHTLNCGHSYCVECIHRYLAVRICDGIIHPKCFHPLAVNNQLNVVSTNSSFSNEIFSIQHALEGTSEESSNRKECFDKKVPDDNLGPSSHAEIMSTGNNYAESDVNLNTANIDVHKEGSSSSIASSSALCDAIISADEIRSLISCDKELADKFEYFKYIKENQNARECPSCQHMQIGNQESPQMTCEMCGDVYCFLHSKAHPHITCQEYEKLFEAENAKNVLYISTFSKACPGCNLAIEKSGGCNHMKCSQCGTSFCWLCGQAIQDTAFPNHFQWWYLSRCANLQMNDAIEEPTVFSRTYARTVAFFQFIVIGPIAIATTIVHLLTCCCCLPLWIISVPSEVPRSIKHRVVNILSNWLTCWCTIWTSFISMMAYLVFLSLCFVPYLIYFIIRCLTDFMVAVVHFLSYACCLCCRPSPFSRTQAQAQDIVAASAVEGLDSERGLVGLDPLPYDSHDLQDALRVYIASHSSSGSNKQESSHTQPLPQPEIDVQVKAICDASERIENVYIYEDVEAGHVYYPLPLALPLSKKRESNVSSHGILGSKAYEANQINEVKVTGSYARSREANMLMQQCGKVAEGVGDGADQCSSPPSVLSALDNFEYDLYSDEEAVDLPDSANSVGNDARKEEEEVEEEMASRHCELKDSDCFEEKESLSYFVKGLDTADNKKRKLEISKNSEITAV